jgi:hypothetical protein
MTSPLHSVDLESIKLRNAQLSSQWVGPRPVQTQNASGGRLERYRPLTTVENSACVVHGDSTNCYCSFAYSDLASFRIREKWPTPRLDGVSQNKRLDLLLAGQRSHAA